MNNPVPVSVISVPRPPSPAAAPVSRASTASSRPVPLVLVGCGAVAKLFYQPALLELRRQGVVQVVAVVDPVPAARQALGAALDAKPCATLVDAFPLGGELAIVASPPSLHRSHAQAALGAGLHVLCEKPVAPQSTDVEAMIASAIRAKRYLAAGHYKRFFPAHRVLKTLIEQEIFGPLRWVKIVEGGKFSWPAATDSFFRKEQTPGGVLLDIGVHVLDLLLWWLGEPQALSYADDANGGLEANCSINAEFDRDVTVSVRLSRDWATQNCAVFRFDRCTVHCRVNASNQLELTFDNLPLTFAAELRTALPAKPAAPSVPLETNAQAFLAQLVDVCDAIRNHRAPSVTGADALRVMQLIERCYAHRAALAQPWLSPTP